MKIHPKKKQKREEMRKSPRIDAVKKVKFKVLAPLEGEGFTQDISERGLCIFLNKEVTPGSVLALKLENLGEGNKPINIIAKVIWQEDLLTGVTFLN
jgi:hypothetical protein